MENDKQWDKVITSMEGSSRAKPDPALFSKIESRVEVKTVRLFPLQIAASIAFLLLNGFAFQQLSASHKSEAFSSMNSENGNNELVSNFNLYE
jgi:hypothetical protein